MALCEIPKEYLIPDGTIRKVTVPNLTFCLVYHADKWIAFSKKCPHAGAPLDQGWCVDGFVVCAYHRQQFNLTTGRGLEGQGNYIRIYPVLELEEKWWIEVKTSFLQRLFSGS